MVTSVCLVIAWVLIVSYQIFTKTALTTITLFSKVPAPFIASSLNSNISVGIFLFSFCLDVCSILRHHKLHRWQRQKNFHTIFSQFRINRDKLRPLRSGEKLRSKLIKPEPSKRIFSTVWQRVFCVFLSFSAFYFHVSYRFSPLKKNESEKVKRHKGILIQNNGDLTMSDQPNMATIQLNGDKQNFIIDKKDFKTGSRGYYGTGKMVGWGQKVPDKHTSCGNRFKAKRRKERKVTFYNFFFLILFIILFTARLMQ